MNSKEPLKLKNKNEKRFSAKHLKRCGTLIFELIGDSKKKAFRSIQTRALSSMIKPFKFSHSELKANTKTKLLKI